MTAEYRSNQIYISPRWRWILRCLAKRAFADATTSEEVLEKLLETVKGSTMPISDIIRQLDAIWQKREALDKEASGEPF